jgi:hypothetical protein
MRRDDHDGVNSKRMETKMITMTMLKTAITAVAMAATISQAQAETAFDTLAGIEAEPMNAQEMDAV